MWERNALLWTLKKPQNSSNAILLKTLQLLQPNYCKKKTASKTIFETASFKTLWNRSSRPDRINCTYIINPKSSIYKTRFLSQGLSQTAKSLIKLIGFSLRKFILLVSPKLLSNTKSGCLFAILLVKKIASFLVETADRCVVILITSKLISYI